MAGWPEPVASPRVRPPLHRRWAGRLFLAGLLLISIADQVRPPAEQWSTRGLVAAIHLYQATISKVLPAAGVHCRFTPTCSHYGEGVILKYGAARGVWLAAWRVLRCGPWTPAGTVDPP